MSSAPARADLYGRQVTAGTPTATIIPQPNAQVPLDASFTDEDGKTVHLSDYFHGKPVILSLVYYECPMLCGITLQGIKDGIADGPKGLRLGADYDIITISFNPNEKPALAKAKRDNYMSALARAAANKGAVAPTGGWHFLTGEYTQITRVAHTVGFAYALDPTTSQYQHQSAIFVLTPEGRVAQTIGGVYFSEPDVSLRDQLINASQAKIAPGMLQLALTCGLMKFDAATGRYVHSPWMWSATIGGMLILITVGSFLGTLWYGEYKRAHPKTGIHPPLTSAS